MPSIAAHTGVVAVTLIVPRMIVKHVIVLLVFVNPVVMQMLVIHATALVPV